jgi:orotidine-5'-phosphate decarboxylase
LAAPAQLAAETGKGLFVLTATSNPESVGIQTATITRGDQTDRTVSASIVAEVNSWNRAPLGDIGVVVGATVRLGDYGIADTDLAATPILAPGFGHQGIGFDALHTVYGSAAGNVVVSSSRAILEAGPVDIAGVIAAHTHQLSEVYSR